MSPKFRCQARHPSEKYCKIQLTGKKIFHKGDKTKHKQALNLPMHRPFFVNVFLNISLPWGATARLQPQRREVHNKEEGELGAKM